MSVEKRAPRSAERGSTFNPKIHTPIVMSLIEKGFTMDEVASAIDINRNTLYKWAREFPDLRAAMTKSKQVVISFVEDALLTRAKGRMVVERKRKKIRNPDGSITETVETNERYIPGDVMAQKFYLTNRHGKEWQDKQKVETQQLRPLVFDSAYEEVKDVEIVKPTQIEDKTNEK